MWRYEYETETPVGRAALWAVLSDVDNQADWDTSMESVRLDGPFAVGSTVHLQPSGQDPVTTTIVDIAEQRRYADQLDMGGATFRFVHELADAPAGGSRVTFRLEVSGPAADKVGAEVGPMITADFPDAVAGLVARAT